MSSLLVSNLGFFFRACCFGRRRKRLFIRRGGSDNGWMQVEELCKELCHRAGGRGWRFLEIIKDENEGGGESGVGWVTLEGLRGSGV